MKTATYKQNSNWTAKRIVQRFERERCYQRYLQEGSVKNISQYDFTDMLLCRPDAYPETIRKKFDQLRTQAEITQEKDYLKFLDACKEAFKDLMTRRKEDTDKRRNYQLNQLLKGFYKAGGDAQA